MAVKTVEIHRGLGTSAYDFGLYEQGVWLLSRFESPFVTLMGRNLFGDHSSFILLFLVPFYWFDPPTSFLLVVQSVVIALGTFWRDIIIIEIGLHGLNRSLPGFTEARTASNPAFLRRAFMACCAVSSLRYATP